MAVFSYYAVNLSYLVSSYTKITFTKVYFLKVKRLKLNAVIVVIIF